MHRYSRSADLRCQTKSVVSVARHIALFKGSPKLRIHIQIPVRKRLALNRNQGDGSTSRTLDLGRNSSLAVKQKVVPLLLLITGICFGRCVRVQTLPPFLRNLNEPALLLVAN